MNNTVAITQATFDDVTVGRTTSEQVAAVMAAGARSVAFRLDWEDYDRQGYAYRGWVFTESVSPVEYREFGSRAVFYNTNHVTVRRAG